MAIPLLPAGMALLKLMKAAKLAKLAGAAAKGAKFAGSKLAAAGARAGYGGKELLYSTVPDIALSTVFAGQMPGDAGDKALGILSNVAVGQLAAGAGRALVNTKKIRAMQQAGQKVNLFQENAPQIMETVGYGAGGLIGYPVGEKLQATKSYLSGDGFLSPTDKMFVEQDEAMKAELLAAYNAGQSAGARGGYFYDPYTGEVPEGGYYGY